MSRGRERIAHLVTGAPVARLGVVGAPQPAAIEDIAALRELRLRVPDDATAAERVVGDGVVPLPIVDGLVTVADADDWETIILR
jgi:hypothetical protein